MEAAQIYRKRNVFYCIAASPEDNMIAAAGKDGAIHMYRPGTWMFSGSFDAHKRRVTCLGFNAAGTRLASGSADKSVIIWSYPEGAPLFTLRQHKKSISDLTFSPDGTLLATASYDSRLILWSVDVGWDLRSAWGERRSVSSVAFSPDGQYLVTTGYGGELVLLSVPSLEPFRVLPSHRVAAWSPTFSPDGSLLATLGFDSKLVVRSTDDWSLVAVAEIPGGSSRPLCFSHDGSMLAVGSTRTVIVFDTELMERMLELPIRSRGSFDIEFSADDHYLLVGCSDKRVHIWDIRELTVVS